MSEWRDISTAPKDGTAFQARIPGHGEDNIIAWFDGLLDETDLLVLDESLYALGAGLLTREGIECLLDAAQTRGVHVVLSGRGLPEWLAERADLITEMTEIKHPWQQGVAAAKGIEF